MLELYVRKTQIINNLEIGNTNLVLIEGHHKKTGQLVGRNEFYLKVLVNQMDISTQDGGKRKIEVGDYVAVKILNAKSSSLSGVPLCHTSVREFYGGHVWPQSNYIESVNV